jgi:hypothetical protein
LRVKHTVRDDYKFSLKGLAAMQIVKQIQEGDCKLDGFRNKLPHDLFEYLGQCNQGIIFISIIYTYIYTYTYNINY